ncbi:MAG: hypothetical protein DRI01_09420 [Chloroflexi bacterium]|nr:MAG: hypothetical protein DRI01_09420 [Chloroflexota bacterium]
MQEARDIEGLKVLGNETRLRILEILSDLREYTYSELKKATNLSSSLLAYHLKQLQRLGFIQKMPMGKYQITRSGYFAITKVFEIERRARGQEMSTMWVVRD